MPLYEYVCKVCDKEQEVLQNIDSSAPECCEEQMERQISLSSFVLKGSGWYATDYKDKK